MRFFSMACAFHLFLAGFWLWPSRKDSPGTKSQPCSSHCAFLYLVGKYRGSPLPAGRVISGNLTSGDIDQPAMMNCLLLFIIHTSPKSTTITVRQLLLAASHDHGEMRRCAAGCHQAQPDHRVGNRRRASPQDVIGRAATASDQNAAGGSVWNLSPWISKRGKR